MSRKIMYRSLFLSLFAMHTPAFGAVEQSSHSFTASVQNVTAANLLSPYLVIVHKAGSSLFDVGSPASAGLQQLAETGATTLIQEELAQNADVLSVSKVEGMPLIAAESRSLDFSVKGEDLKAGALVTVVAMIGKSNDSFISLKDLPLRSLRAQPLSFKAENFDAGTEENTGNTEDLNATNHPVAAAEGHISYDRGLNPNGNAPEILRWGSVAAKVTFVENR